MMTDPIVIFLLIGSAHAAAHVMQCEACRNTMWNFLLMILEVTTKMLGWPLAVIEYIVAFIRWRDDKKASFGGPMTLEFKQHENENDEDFKIRIEKETATFVDNMRSRFQGKKEP